ncbi:sulfite exporter TauE/SafE family protein [Weissella ceti]|uniref:Probable membrane transporter protein n=1 Tax=Weissella ceti TaxID=759620 RepID=A0ABT3E412_9LACO|nr:sulfite exporter TauE/SafE family protein [Weissella ceti]MCW0952657.1 sulfite exporter TauE/SafE family protein [Weissella ceti]QVK12362.1 sulfite exporter TauE/SafE family protein [Weissella ceti]
MIEQLIIMLITGIAAGIFGSLLGLGGGMIVTPILTVFLGVDIKTAIGASIIAVIATSSGSAIAFLKDDIVNLRVAMFLEIFTTIGALLGAILSGYMKATWLFFLFGALLLFQVWNMINKIRHPNTDAILNRKDPIATKLQLNGAYYDKQQKETITYTLEHVPAGSSVMFGAGIASGLLGIGSGAFKVMAMDGVMKMPLKPSSATSNVMMGVTAAASALVYFFNGLLQPLIAVPMALGVVAGAAVGSRLMQYLPAKLLRYIFVPVVLIMAIQLLMKGFGL